MATNSRLTRNIEKKSRHMLYLGIGGIVLIIVLFFRFGIPLLINFSLFVAGRNNNDSSTANSNSPSYLAAPILNPTFTATNSAQVVISGVGTNHEVVDLYVNDKLTDSTDTKDDGSFTFKNVPLQSGDNLLKVRAKSGNTKSDFSEATTITYKNSPVSLTVDNPHDGDTFSKDQNTVIVSGKTDPDAKVTVNDFWAIVDDKGNYSYNLHLNNGDNAVKVVATDPAGNKTENDLKVTYSQ